MSRLWRWLIPLAAVPVLGLLAYGFRLTICGPRSHGRSAQGGCRAKYQRTRQRKDCPDVAPAAPTLVNPGTSLHSSTSTRVSLNRRGGSSPPLFFFPHFAPTSRFTWRRAHPLLETGTYSPDRYGRKITPFRASFNAR
jgi:hypothetical protein